MNINKSHQCPRCYKVFKTSTLLRRHENAKRKCKVINFDKNNNTFVVSVDDIILDEDNIKFDELPEFNFKEKMEKDQCYSVIFAAVRRSGKTTVIKNLIYDQMKKDYDIVIFLSNSIHNKIYSFVDEPKFNDYYPGLIDDLMTFQEETGNIFRICIIMDDLVSYNKKNDDSLMQLYTRGRNVNITVILSSQSTTLINKNNRGNSDFILIGNNPSAEFRETVIKAFLLGIVKPPKEIATKTSREDYLHKYILHYTVNHGFLVLDNIENKIYHLRLKIK